MLALYIIVGAVTLAVACVSLNFSGNQYLVSNSITDFFLCPVGTIGRKKRKTLELSNRHRLRCSVESGKVSTSPQHSVQVHITQTLHPFLQSHPCVLAEDF